MSVIEILPSDVADQIAAGEVVERPASAVKELIENALDAGARAITVDVSDGGRDSIRVSDDGCGMDRADAVLALQRHATSKIRRTEDLVGVRSYGFRGEALPAIGSVSQLTLETATDDGAGTCVRVAGGAVVDVADTARQRGTTVVVSRLFYNVPARLKFMRGTRSEWRAVADAVTAVAMSRREAHVTLTHDGRLAMALPAASSLRERIGGIWTAGYADSLLEVGDATGAATVTGLVERPADVGTRTRRVHLAVNGRAIRDGGLVRAAEAAYRSTVPAGMRPSLFLEIAVAADAVDVNVHPAKAEVRFRDRWPVERAVETAVRHALGTVASSASVAPRIWVSGAAFAAGGSAMSRGPSDARLAPDQMRALTPYDDRALRDGGGWAALVGPNTALDHRELFATVGDDAEDGAIPVVVPPLQQLRRTYLMCETPAGLVFIDQHSAHERVLFEQFLSAFDSGQLPSQRLLFPFTMHLSAASAEAFEAHRDQLVRLGFEVEAFGGHTIVVHAVPAPHARFDAERCLRETLDGLTGDRLASTAQQHERLIATLSCKAAVKAGDELSATEMRALYIALARTKLPAHDVHGRSTIVRLGWDEVERRFGRR